MTELPHLVQDADIEKIWHTELRAVGCLNCGIAHLEPAGGGLSRCPACLAPELDPQPARLRPESPELVVPFASSLTPDRLSDCLSGWLRGVWLRPHDMRVEQLLARLMRVYLPMWLVDGEVVGSWSARMGYDYQVESAQERFSEVSGWKTRRLVETHIRWEPRVGWLGRTYHNLTVPALDAQEEQALMARLGRYELDEAVAYTPAAIADAVVRIPSLLPREAWPQGRGAFDRSAAADCRRAAGAQHSDEFALNADYRDLNWTQLLLPFFLTYYLDDAGRSVPLWINGQNGQVSGTRRASLRKGWAVTGAIGLVAALVFLVGALLTLLEVGAVAALLMMAGFFLTVVAALPVLWAWQFNQRSL